MQQQPCTGEPSTTTTCSSRVVKALPDARDGAASILVAKVVDLMSMHLDAGVLLNNPPLLADLCFSLAKGIDHAVANNEVPRRCCDLPPLLKQVYGSPNNLAVQVGLMMLTMSIQCACKLEWFSDQETDDLLKLAKETMKSFSDPEYILIEPAHASYWVSAVMSRFYPNMKVERLLFSVQLQSGYRFCVANFPIRRGTISPKQEKVHLLVVHVDNLATSACIITPAEANFLLNGQGVEGRTIVSMDKGPQLPTNVTGKLKFGVNCLQAIGQFKGNYLVVIAVMTTTQSFNLLELQDVKPIALTNSETQTMQMSSRISLNCPISKSRIKMPAKGKLCKHFQCFDYDNFLEINSKRPSWECPHCKQPVCYVDICIDPNFVKVLSEAEEKVVNVIMSANGAWKEDKDHPSQMSGDSQVGHQNDESRSTTDRSTSLQNYNEIVSAAGTSVPTQKPPLNVLCSAFNIKGPANNGSHHNSVQLLQKDGPPHAQSSGANISSTRLSFKQQIQQHWSLSNLNTGEALSNTESVVCSSVPAPMEPGERIATIQTSSAVHQAARLPKDAPFLFTTPRASSRMNSMMVDSTVVVEARRIRNDELQSLDAADGESAHWRPTNRMRGGLRGEAYSAALQQFGIQPTLRAQASRPPFSAVSIRGPITNAVADRSASASQTKKS
ncbi:E4 SUMO-protein ligase PIAL2-like [Coffea eugenioides]|uniref:E4 SUMO-protein ligase PIAL2-like n=1 Tax=Coffea eugenioides TaxID=49369 RepID=UPI000F608A64|nr:E4 SUMO-protein ligase PIAL2-like [Coffea eugenioides]